MVVGTAKKNNNQKCPECGSENLIKHGIRFAGRKGDRKKVQQFQCKGCGRITVKPIGGASSNGKSGR